MKTRNLIQTTLVLLLICNCSVTAASQWVAFDASGNDLVEIELIQSTNTTVIFDVYVPGMDVIEQTWDYIDYDRLRIIGGSMTDELGYPEVPEVRVQVCVPQCSDISIVSTSLQSTSLSSYNLYPVPEIILDSLKTGFFWESFYKDLLAYTTPGFYPTETAVVSELNDFRGQKFVQVKVCPITHDPTTGALAVVIKQRIELQFANPVGEVNANLYGFGDVGEALFVNPTPFIPNDFAVGESTWLEGNEDPGSVDADYLMIVADAFVDVSDSRELVEEYAEYRARMNGLRVRLVRYGDIGADDEYDLWEYLNAIYQSENGQDKLRYLCLVGDAYYDQHTMVNDDEDFIGPPPWHTVMIPTGERRNDFRGGGWGLRRLWDNDYYYSRLHGNDSHSDAIPWSAQISVGRISVSTHIELERVINKIRDYETQNDPTNYRDRIFYTCGDRGPAQDWPDWGPNFLNFYADYCDYQFRAMSRSVPEEFFTTYQYPYENIDNMHFRGEFDELIQVGEVEEVGEMNEEARGSIRDQLEIGEGEGEDEDGCLIWYFAGHGHDYDRFCFGLMEPDLDAPDINEDPPISQRPEVSNDGQLPFIFLTSCWVGHFNRDEEAVFVDVDRNNRECHWVHDGWAEILAVKSDSGAVGVVAAPYPVLCHSNAYGTALSMVLNQYYPEKDGMVAGNLLMGVFNHSHISDFTPRGEERRFDFRGNYTYFGDPGLNMNWNTSTISGNINENTEWSDKIFISNDVTVANNVTLTINPRTEIIFLGDFDLKINGRLVADGGTSASRIRFKSIAEEEGSIWFDNSSGNNLGNTFRYCEVGGIYEIRIEESDVTFIHNIVHDCFNGVNSILSDVNINSSHFYDNARWGIIINNDAGGFCFVEDTKSNNNGYDGLWVTQNVTCFISNCEFNDNHWYGLFSTSGGLPYLYGNDLNNNTFGIVALNDADPLIGNGQLDYLNNIIHNFDAAIELVNASMIITGNHNNIVSIGENDDLLNDFSNPFPGHDLGGNFLGPGELVADRFFPVAIGEDDWDISDVDENLNIRPDDLREDRMVLGLLKESIERMRNEEFNQAARGFHRILSDYEESKYAVTALNGAYHCTRYLGNLNNNYRRYLISLVYGTENALLEKRARRHSIRVLVANRRYNEALNEFAQMLRNAPNRRDSLMIAMEFANVANLMNNRRGNRNPEARSINPGVEADFSDLMVNDNTAFIKKICELRGLLNSTAADRTSNLIPKDYFISQNYPNPFNSITRLNYGLPTAGNVIISIYDVSGRLITTLINDKQPAGHHVTIWETGETSSGLYLIRMETAGFSKVQKLVLTK